MDAEIFYVLVGAVAVAAFARWRGWPAPLLVTVVALVVSLLPFVPDVAIDGHLLLNLVLPPLLYSASIDVSFLGFRQSMPHIRRLGVGLVIVTAAVAGVAAWLVLPELTLPGALLLGAIVAPPDAVSAAAIGRRLGLPRRVMNVLSGESLINDATSLTLVRVFAAIVAGATLTVWDGVWQFVLAVVVGVAVGVVFGVALHRLRLRVADPVVIGTVGLLVPFGAYAIGEHLGGSGVLAVVAMGLFVGYNAPRTSYATRQQERPLWLSADFLLESFVFAYIGLQFPRVLGELGSQSAGPILVVSALVLSAALVVRPVFVYTAYAWGRLLQRWRLRRWERVAAMRPERIGGAGRRGRRTLSAEQIRERLTEPELSRPDRAVVSWAGMRGVVTLATAAAVPDLTDGALTTTAEHAIVVAAFIVTVGTLMLQGLTLPPLIRRLDVAATDEREEDERQLAAVRARSNEAGMAYLQRQREEWEQRFGPEIGKLFDRLSASITRIGRDSDREREAVAGAEAGGGTRRPSHQDVIALQKGWLDVRRALVLAERDAGQLGEEVMRELIFAMDAEELALDTRGSLRMPDRA